MSFVQQFNRLPLRNLASFAESISPYELETALGNRGVESHRLDSFAALISPTAGQPEYLEELAQRAHELTVRHFGKVIRLFAPLYLSN